MNTKTITPNKVAFAAAAAAGTIAFFSSLAPVLAEKVRESSHYEGNNLMGSVLLTAVMIIIAAAAAIGALAGANKRASDALAAANKRASNERVHKESLDVLNRYYKVRNDSLAAAAAAAAADAAAAAQIKALQIELAATRRAFNAALIAAAAANASTAAADIMIAAAHQRYAAAAYKVKVGKGGTKLTAAVAYAAAVVRTATDGGDIAPAMIVEFNKALSLMWDETANFNNCGDEPAWVGGVSPRIH